MVYITSRSFPAKCAILDKAKAPWMPVAMLSVYSFAAPMISNEKPCEELQLPLTREVWDRVNGSESVTSARETVIATALRPPNAPSSSLSYVVVVTTLVYSTVSDTSFLIKR